MVPSKQRWPQLAVSALLGCPTESSQGRTLGDFALRPNP